MTKEFLDYHVINAQSGSIHSLWLLGLNYLRGDATEPDMHKAYSYFMQMIKQKYLMDSYPELNLIIGFGHALGIGGLRKDFVKAK